MEIFNSILYLCKNKDYQFDVLDYIYVYVHSVL